MSINRVRGVLYRLARLLGDVNAVEKHRVVPRIERRLVGRWTARISARRRAASTVARGRGSLHRLSGLVWAAVWVEELCLSSARGSRPS